MRRSNWDIKYTTTHSPLGVEKPQDETQYQCRNSAALLLAGFEENISDTTTGIDDENLRSVRHNEGPSGV